MIVPFLDLSAHHESLKAEFLNAIEDVISSNAFAGGKYVEAFETEFADYCGTEHAIGVGSGTESLWLILKALNIGPGDEVITVPNTFFATAEAISHTGATPVFVDICEATANLDPSRLSDAITTRTKAIIPVHLFGQSADMEPIRSIAESNGIHLIEDAAQAHGAEYHNQRVGSFGIAACFSFYPGKNLGAFGEAGAITTSDPELAERIRMLRDHGQSKKYRHDLIGWNARMDGIQGAVLRIKLRHLEETIEKRTGNARRYLGNLLEVSGIQTPVVLSDTRHVWHLFVIRTTNRDRVIESLKINGVDCGIHYPIPIHLQSAYKSLGYQKGDFPIAEEWANSCISLPLYPELTGAQVDYVSDVLAEATTVEIEDPIPQLAITEV